MFTSDRKILLFSIVYQDINCNTKRYFTLIANAVEYLFDQPLGGIFNF